MDKAGALSHLFQSLNRLFQVRGFEPERAWSAFEDHPPIPIDQIQPVWPPRVRLLYPIVDPIDQRWHANPQIAHAAIGHLHAFRVRPRIAENHALADIAPHLPDIAGVRLLDVDREERYAVAIGFE